MYKPMCYVGNANKISKIMTMLLKTIQRLFELTLIMQTPIIFAGTVTIQLVEMKMQLKITNKLLK